MRITFSLILLILCTSCSKQTVSRFIDQVKENRSAFALTIPGWVISKSTDLALKGIKEDDEKVIISLGKKIRQIRVVTDSNSQINQEELRAVVQSMQINDQYEPYTIVKHDGADVFVMVQEKENIIEDLAILVHKDRQTTVLHLKTKLTLEELERTNFSWNKKNQ